MKGSNGLQVLAGSQCSKILWIQLLQIAQDPHLTITLAVVGGACMGVADSRGASCVGVTSPFQQSQHRKQFRRKADKKSRS